LNWVLGLRWLAELQEASRLDVLLGSLLAILLSCQLTLHGIGLLLLLLTGHSRICLLRLYIILNLLSILLLLLVIFSFGISLSKSLLSGDLGTVLLRIIGWLGLLIVAWLLLDLCKLLLIIG
jgi:hypothetical protein